jgi:aryl-alcohol dehydrogenase-like predicted oxidoreductase
MPLPASSRVQFTADLSICRILNGMWQVSGAHGAVDPVRAVDAMSAYHETGFTTWDLADHYGPAEDFIGDFLRRFAVRHGVDRLPEIQAFTKWVPRPGRMTRRVVEDAIKHLSDLQQEGKIRHLALTNFDTEHLSAIADHGVHVVSNQVQYSLVDRRPEVRMARFCSDHPMTLLAYGTLLGGLLSQKYLGRPEPRRSELNTASLQKYKNVLDAWGDWPLFQKLLAVLQRAASRLRLTRQPNHGEGTVWAWPS